MKNWEKYGKEIQELQTTIFGINKDGRIFPCHFLICKECEFKSMNCDYERTSWLYAEYEKPKPKLTKEDFILLNALEHPVDMTIRRYEDGELYLNTYVIHVGLKKHMFSFILPGQEYSVIELKELKVKEGE